MTTPAQSRSAGSKRFYLHPVTGEKAWSVTTILKAIPKQALLYWAANEVAAAALADPGWLAEKFRRDGYDVTYDWLKKTPWAKSKKAMDLGSAIHAACEACVLGQEIPAFAGEVAPYVEQFGRFVVDFAPRFELVEATVWNSTQCYAGTLDAVAEIDGRLLVLDAKTTADTLKPPPPPPPYPEAALQLAAYRHAEKVLLADGSEHPMPKTVGGAVLVLRPDRYDLVPVRCDETIFTAFLFIRECFRWMEETSKTVVGEPVGPPVRETAR